MIPAAAAALDHCIGQVIDWRETRSVSTGPIGCWFLDS
jgi:hypothetical protein